MWKMWICEEVGKNILGSLPTALRQRGEMSVDAELLEGRDWVLVSILVPASPTDGTW